MFPGVGNTTGKVDEAFLFIVACCVILLIVVTACMVVFVIKYNRKRHPRAEHVKESVLLEIIWTVVPTILALLMFYIGWINFNYIRNAPPDAMTVQVTARQWSWLFTYSSGLQSDELRVPRGTPVKLLMTSVDVIHSLFIPAYRIKEDCVPGLTTHLWFSGDETGSYDIFCTEYCGLGHSHMRSRVIVMSPDEFDRWYQASPVKTATALGPKTLQAKGCLGCHSLDGSPKIGPTFKGIIKRKETVIEGGQEKGIIVDTTFIRSKILNPRLATVKGYPPVMPPIPMTDIEIEAVAAYLETIK
jgi:cytochrome c oxidase subunit II